MRILHHPHMAQNPYQNLMFRALRKQGVDPCFMEGGLLRFLNHVATGREEILHLHWTSWVVTVDSFIVFLLRFVVFHVGLILWRLRRKRIIWTVHNLSNHEKRRPALERLNSVLVALFANQILVHGESVKSIVAEKFKVRANKIRVVYHGNYNGIVVPSPLGKKDYNGIRFLFFGTVRPYKGLLELIDEFSRLKGDHRLHIEGSPINDDLRHEIKNKARNVARVSHSLQVFTDNELQLLLDWCDVVVLPFKEITTSGSLLMAITAGRPVIAPRIGLIPEYVDGQCAFLYDPKNPNELYRALQEATNCINLQSFATASLKRAQRYCWDDIAGDLIRIYNNIK